MRGIGKRAAVVAGLWALAGAGVAAAAVTCEQSGGDPARPTTLRIVIESPADGDVVAPTTGCGGSVRVAGSFVVDAPPLLYDFYVVIDASGSTDADSGADVDGDGVLREADDTIYRAEIAAAEAFIRALDPASSRVAIIRFNRDAPVRQQLTPDLAAALATLDAMRGDRPRFGTGYVPAMESVRLEMLARGDLAGRLQRCVFLSDGVPDETLVQTDAKASELAGQGLVMDTFALGFPDSEALRSMALITGGTFTPLPVPGAIVDLLPSFVPDVPHSLDGREDVSGSAGTVIVDEVSGTFEAVVPLHPGANRVVLTLSAGGGAPMTVTCTIDLTMTEALVADAGPAVRACRGSRGWLDGGASATACAPIYRWLDCTGSVLADWSASPRLEIDPCALPCEAVTLELACAGDPCVASAVTVATCVSAPVPAPVLVSACGLSATLDCGVADPALLAWWDLDPSVDGDGNGDAADDADASGCAIEHRFDAPGARGLVAWMGDRASGCATAAPLDVVLAPLPPARDIAGGVCPGMLAGFSCGTAEAGVDYWWDFDGGTDADFDGDATNDPDALGCDASHAWAATGSPAVHGWARDSSGCRRLVAAGIMDVSAGAMPGEARDLRLSRRGDAITLAWAPAPGASAHRVLRGTLLPLQARGIYDHAADDGASRGACEARGLAFGDPDDAADPEASYYLVTAINPCAGEGPAGFGFDGRRELDRPARLPMPGCP